MRKYSLIWLALACLTAGCGRGIETGFKEIALLYKADPSYAYYHSYGDSITAGYGLASVSTEGYPALVAGFNSLPLNNYAIPGDQACDVPVRQIFPAQDHPSLSKKAVYTLLISTNDVNVKGAGLYETVFNLCHQASIAWLATPEEWKIEASSNVVTTSGPTHIETTGYWNALITEAKGASISVPFSHPDTGPVYIWYRIGDGNPGSFNYALDGIVLNSATTGTAPAIATQNGRNNSLALLRLPSIPAGAHVLRFTQTSTADYGMGIVAIGLPQAVQTGTLPRVLVGTTPRQLKGGNGTCSNSTAVCEAYTADITANVNLIQGDGLHVTLFNSTTYEQGTTADLLDSLHPNALGQQELFRSVEDVVGAKNF